MLFVQASFQAEDYLERRNESVNFFQPLIPSGEVDKVLSMEYPKGPTLGTSQMKALLRRRLKASAHENSKRRKHESQIQDC